MTTVACIVIATERRRALVEEHVMPSVASQGFDEIVLVGDWLVSARGDKTRWYTHACVEPMLRNTTDALVKRDVGTLMTVSENLVFLCDDHALGPHFLASLREVLDEPWDVIVPNRYTIRHFPELGLDDAGQAGPADSVRFHHPAPSALVALNNGERDGYCGGHAGIFRRAVVTARPWSAHSLSREWDARISFSQRLAGARFVWHPRAGIAIEDIEPGAEPWK